MYRSDIENECLSLLKCAMSPRKKIMNKGPSRYSNILSKWKYQGSLGAKLELKWNNTTGKYIRPYWMSELISQANMIRKEKKRM